MLAFYDVLMDDNYEVDGHALDERNPKWLQDDYVKFIRFAQWRIEQTGAGVLAYISNNGYVDNPTFRGMRQSLMDTFDEIYILNLHGDARKGERTPDGGTDENVFDIMQGVGIGLFVKKSDRDKQPDVYHKDLWGRREDKYNWLLKRELDTTSWNAISPQSPYYLFKPEDVNLRSEYEVGWPVSEVMPVGSMGITTGRDAFVVAFSRHQLEEQIEELASSKLDESIRKKYDLRDSTSFRLQDARVWARTSRAASAIRPVSYRCFDRRYIIYSSAVLARDRKEVCRHLTNTQNLALIAFRSIRELPWFHSFVTRNIAVKEFISSLDNCYLYPLYLYPDDDAARLFDETATSPWQPDSDHNGRVPNLSKASVADLEDKLDLGFDPHKTDSASGETFGPRDVLAYIYAVLHSPTYRERYAEFLKIDFPRIPLTSYVDLFWDLVGLGSELIDLHLMDHPKLAETITSFPVPGNNQVKPRGGYPKFIPAGESRTKTSETAEENRVYINLKQYFKGVPKDVWEFQVGGYQVLHKWLKDRKGRVLSYDDLEHYQQIVVALKETMRLMGEIDEAIPQWPIE